MMPSLFYKNSGNANQSTGGKSNRSESLTSQQQNGAGKVLVVEKDSTGSRICTTTVDQQRYRKPSSSPVTVPPPPSLSPRQAVPAPDLQRFGRPPAGSSSSSSKHQYTSRCQPQHVTTPRSESPREQQRSRPYDRDRSSLRLSAVVRGSSGGSGNSSEPGGAIAYHEHTAVIPQGSLIESGSDLAGLTSSDNTLVSDIIPQRPLSSAWWPGGLGAGAVTGDNLIDSFRSLGSSNSGSKGGAGDSSLVEDKVNRVIPPSTISKRDHSTAQALTNIFRGETNGTQSTFNTTDSERTNPMSNISSSNAVAATQTRQPHGPLSSLAAASPAPLPPRPELTRTPSLVRQHSHRRMVSTTVPIEAQYAKNFQLRQLFDQVFSQGPHHYLLSFEMGANFCENALYELPKHGYYHSKKHIQQRKQSNYDALRISDILQSIIVPRLSEHDLIQLEAANQNVQRELLKTYHDPEQTRTFLLEEAKWLFSQAKKLSDPVVHNDYIARRHRLLKEATPSSLGGANKKKSGGGFFSGKLSLPSINPKPKKIAPQGGSRDQSPSSANSQETLVQQQQPQQALMYYEQQQQQRQTSMPLPTPRHIRETSMEQIKADLISLSLCGIVPPSLIAQSSSFVDSDAASKSASTTESRNAAIGNRRQTQVHLPPKVMTSNQLIPVDDDPISQSPSNRIYPSWGDASRSPATEQSHPPAATKSAIAAGGVLAINRDEAHIAGTTVTATTTSTSSKKRDVVPVSVLKSMYAEDFIECTRRGTIQIQTCKTYQGRIPASTNGCTVIAPLLAIHYMQLSNNEYELSQDQIEQVIDQESCLILPQVRQELELTQDALIVPSDVHDHLIQIGLLSQDHFVGVTGGNIMDDWHIHELLKMLTSQGEHKSHRGKKVAATLFFHEHVVTILTLQQPQTATIGGYDLIDSFPSRQTLFPNETISSSTSQDVIMENVNETATAPAPCNGVRYRCRDLESLQTLIKWYSISKFTTDDATFIDELEWDDNDGRAPFDPRIFQAFVWAS